MAKHVAVIGGGLGALSGAIRLATSGFRVQLFEQNARLGGKIGEVSLGPYRFDTGPSLLTMPFVVDDLFRAAGSEASSRIEYVPVDPVCRYFFSDGSRIDAHDDRKRMIEAIDRLSPSDASAYTDFLEYAARIYRRTADVFLFTPIHETRKLLRWRYLPTLLKLYQIDPFRTVHQSVSRFFSDPRLVQLFDRYATYNGSDPFQAPATLNIIPYVEYELGGYYIRGGMYRLVDALEDLASSVGVEIHTSAKVERVLMDRRRVNGVSVDGERIDADYVLCGADVVVAHEELIPGAPSLEDLEPSLSGMVFLWGVNKHFPELPHHTILFSADYRKEFDQIFQERRAPDDPTVYIAITSRADPDHAPSHGENWFVLLNMPYLEDGQRWAEEKERMRATVMAKLASTGVDAATHIDAEQVYTPEDFRQLYASNRGSIYGISSNSRDTAFKRPPNRSRFAQGLYFAGGSTHPGGGIPLVMLSGKIAADLIVEAESRR